MTHSESAVQTPVAAAGSAESETAYGAITLARHGEPALSRKCMITQALLSTAEGAGAIYASTRPRAQETARAVAPGRDVLVDALFIEAPLPPPHFPAWIKLSPRYWGVISRIWWHAFNHHEGQETRAEAEVRADQAARVLIARASEGHDVLVLAHGYFNHMVGQRLKAHGWRLAHNQGFKYWSQRRFVKR